MTESIEHIIGIDLGTTNSVVSILDEEKPVVINNSEGGASTPSVVCFQEDGQVVVGSLAQRQAAVHPQRTIRAVKRLMGRFHSDLTPEELRRPYAIVADEDDNVLVEIDGQGYSPSQISSLILAKLKQDAEDYLGCEVKKAVITVPAYFDDLQREATVRAAQLANLDVLRLINEPTAAAMAYGLGREGQETIAIYDFGGGTFDMSLLDVDANSFEVLATHGDTNLGGEDIDNLLIDVVSNQFLQDHEIDLRQDPMTLSRLKDTVCQAKCDLSIMPQAIINLPFIAYKGEEPLHLNMTLARPAFEEMIEPIVERTIKVCKQVLNDAGLKRSDIQRVIMVGGSSRIPLVQDLVADFFDLDPFKGVNPDEVVAMGAATQAGVFEGKLEEVVLMDVTPHSLGIEVFGGRCSKIIEKNSTVPIKAAKIFTTTEDNQEFVAVHVLQGESENSADNRSLGKFTLSGITPRPKGAPRIQVTFFINSDGIVEISAKDVESGAEEVLSIVHSHLDESERRDRRSRRSRDPRRRRRSNSASDVVIPAFSGVNLGGDGKAPPLKAPSAAASDIHEPQALGPGLQASSVASALSAASREEVPVAEASMDSAPTACDDTTAQMEPAVGPPPAEDSLFIPTKGVDEARLRQAEACIRQGRDDKEARELYQLAADDYMEVVKAMNLVGRTPSHPIKSLAYLYILSQQPDESMTLIRKARDAQWVSAADQVEVLEYLLEKYPKYAQAMGEMANALMRINDYEGAIRYAEQAMLSENANTQWVDLLEDLYKESIAIQPDATQEFKLVKIFLRKDKVDEAIEVLQRLVDKPAYQKKAVKILGLCYWQKNLYYMAWQKFKELETSGEIKDVLYRLAADMESDNQLSNAIQVLKHLIGKDPNYQDATAWLERLETQIKIQEENTVEGRTLETLKILNHPRFFVMEEINRGSMGVIYRAKDIVLDEVVALKILNDYLCADPVAVERFKREARAARKLTHSNIVRIHDFYETDTRKFITMEYIQGKDLKYILSKEGPLPPERVAQICAVIADALEFAHSRDVIHRDIKPANVMINQNNEVLVTDLGIAKIVQSDDATLSASVVMGTPLYMSPEQIQGGKIDHRVDIYALGIVMYELLTGRPPFYEGNVEYHHIHTPPPPLPESAPPELATIIYKAIEKDRLKRFERAKELAKALRFFLGE